MKKTLIVALALSLVAGALAMPASAKKKKKKPVRVERVQESRYENPAIGTGGVGACSGCPAVASGPGERYISVEITDDALPIAGVDLSWDTDGDGTADTGITVCNATEEPVEIPEGVSMTGFAFVIAGPECPGGGATTGSIKVTFSNMP